jgi:hypothetical protein
MKTDHITPAVHVHFSRWMLTVLAILVVSPCLIVTAAFVYPHIAQLGNKPFTPHADESGQVVESKPGPWGRLLYANVMIDIPDEFIVLPPADQPPVRWFFQDYDRDRVVELFKSAGISQAQIAKWLTEDAWQSSANGTWVTVCDDMVLSLTPEARSKIYCTIIAFAENADQMDPAWFRPETLDRELSESGLAPSSIKLLKSLLYRNGSSLLLFADKDVALRQLHDDEEKRLFINAISRKATLMARLKIDADTDVNALAAYWGVTGNRKDILPLMNSLQRVEGGWNLNLIYLMPRFIREHLYKYPSPSTDPQAPKQDCFWSAFNAFGTEIDDRFSDMQYARQVLVRDYYTIAQPSQLGDLVFLADSDNQAMHVAVYIADDVVFTKNGFHFTQPWILMHLNDMVETYSARLPAGKKLNVLYCRRKAM